MNLIQLQPDDVLVVSHPSYLSTSQRDAMVEILRQTLGQSQRVLIIDAGQTLDVLRGVDAAQADQDEPAPPQSSWTVDGGPLAEALAQREVQHVDTPDEEPGGIPPHVYLYRNMLTEQQAVAPLGRDETNGQYAVAIDQLTDEQRAIPHVSRQLPGDVLTIDVTEAGMLADGLIKPNDIVRRKPRRSDTPT